jgi:transglutaminase-like putative cysteine protease
MARTDASAAVSVERFFQSSLLGLVASGYLAVAGSGYLDAPTIVLAAGGLLLRLLAIYDLVRLDISPRASTLITIGYTGFYLLDYFLLSRDFLAATVHLVFFLAVMKILTAKTNRDNLYTAVIAFLELLAAAILSINFNFFVFLTVYLLFAIAALTSGEIRRSMQKEGAAARGGARRFHVRLATLSSGVALGILALTAGLFFILPRTADAAFERLISGRVRITGFSNQVLLGEIGEIKATSRPVMHIRAFNELPQGLKWRGGTLVDFDGKRWYNPAGPTQQIPLEHGHAELESPLNRRPGGGVSYQVAYDELETNALFFVGTAASVFLRNESTLIAAEGGNYRVVRPPAPGFHYDAYSFLEEPPDFAPVRPAPLLPLAARERCLQLPKLDPRVSALAHQVTTAAGTDLERARALERYLRKEFGYTLELPSRETPDPLAHFLFTRRKGHCEYFASAMTVMLRTLGIPARLATGFQSGVYNPISELWLIRASDAHTWVEAWLPNHGWSTFDPTPPDPNPAGASLFLKMSLYLDAAETFWQAWVVGYDSGQQGSLLGGARGVSTRWVEALSGIGAAWNERASLWARRFGGYGAAAALIVAWCWLVLPPLIRRLRIRRRVSLVRRGRASVADATLLYQRMLQIVRRHGYHKPAWFTPAEFAGSLPANGLGTAVAEFTEAYNAVRFGGRTEVAPRLSILLDQLERQGRRP